MDNSELSRRITEIAVHLDRVEHMAQWLCDKLQQPPIRQGRAPITPAPTPPEATPQTVNPTWPWEPATLSQGFLSGRFERRDGTVYGSGATAADEHLNSAVRGGEDAQDKVAPESGIPRS